jgi:hypothetical protein
MMQRNIISTKRKNMSLPRDAPCKTWGLSPAQAGIYQAGHKRAQG